MQEQQTATPTDAVKPEAEPSLDDRILAKFGLSETEEAPEPVEATPAPQTTEEQPEVESEEVVVEEETPAVEPLFKLKHNGSEKEVPISEAQRLAQMGYDYEFKMQRVNEDAQKIKSMAQAFQAHVQAQAQVFDAMVEVKAIEKQLAPFANVDWVAEGQNDPIAAFQKRMQHDQLVQAWHQANAKVQQFQPAIQQSSKQIDEAQMALEAQKLTERIPEWKDPAKKQAESKAILEAMVKDFGFKQEEIGGPLLSDHRVVSLLRDAWKYRQAVANQKAKKGPLQGLPKVATPGAKPPPRTAQQSLGDAKRALHQATSKEARRRAEDELIARKFGLK